MFKLLVHVLVSDTFALDGNKVHLYDTGVRITGPGEELFKAEAEVRGIPYKKFMLQELEDKLSQGLGAPAAMSSARALSPFSEDAMEEVTLVYPTSRTSWADGFYHTASINSDGIYDGEEDRHPCRYRIQRYSNRYTQYEVDVDFQEELIILSGEHLTVDEDAATVYGMFVMDEADNEFREYLHITQRVVR